jgi:type I restriction enzyme R subunit
MNEADTCREYVLPKLEEAGWKEEQILPQFYFTDGRVQVIGGTARRLPRKFADYLLKYRRDTMLAVVEAKAEYKQPGDGLQQAKEYAEILHLPFAYATNGKGIVEFDYGAGIVSNLAAFPSPESLWQRYQQQMGLTDEQAVKFLAPMELSKTANIRYCLQIAINKAVEAILKGEKRLLLTIATGTGKTTLAFQVCWKLWKSGWNRSGAPRPPKILFLADRNVLVDDPIKDTFLPFGDARIKIAGGNVVKSREIYFALYQSLAGTEGTPARYKLYPRDFFDLIIVDECHRGSASDHSNWREILEYFAPAVQMGMTATPKRDDNVDTYAYFGNPLYTYSLKQGIEDGFLAPYRLRRILTDLDAEGFRPASGDRDRFGAAIPDAQYMTKDFERVLAHQKRTEAIAKHLTAYLKSTDRFAKTLVFCVDQEHALTMRDALNNANSDLVQQYPDYVCRVTSDEEERGREKLDQFKDLESRTPVILTTSHMLTTGVDAPTCKNVVLVRVINAMTEFKQIIGRGTRVRADYGKLYFTIHDYTGSAAMRFADPEFDGYPALITEQTIDEEGNITSTDVSTEEEETAADAEADGGAGDVGSGSRKIYYDVGNARVVLESASDLDESGKLITMELRSYVAGKVRTLYTSADELRTRWADPVQRKAVIAALDEHAVDFVGLAEEMKRPDADPLDLLCYLTFERPLLTRKQRADRVRKQKKDFFDRYGDKARQVLFDLLQKYEEHGPEDFAIPDVFKLPPFLQLGRPIQIAALFGGAEKMKEAVLELQGLVYQPWTGEYSAASL